MPQSKISVWILILTLLMSLAACGGSSSGPGGNHEPKPDPITTPDSFSFAPQEDVIPGELVESNTITLSGITAAASISISNGEYKLGDGDYTDEDGRIEPGQSLTLRTTAPNRPDTTKEVVVTVGGVSGRFIVTTMEDKEPPEASIVFPNVISATENTELTIRGTAEDALSEIARVTLIVNGTEEYEVETENSFASWQAKVTLTPGAEHTIAVSVEDEHGNVDAEAATAMVHQQAWGEAFPDDGNVFLDATAITYDEVGHRVFVLSPGVKACVVIEVDLVTGKRREISTGVDDFGFGLGLVFDRPRNRLLVTNFSNNVVYFLNLAEGAKLEPLESSSPLDEDQPEFLGPTGIALNPEDPDRAFVVNLGSNNLLELNLDTGRRAMLFENETPDDKHRFGEAWGLLVDVENNKIIVGDSHPSGNVIAVHKETGERTIFSHPTMAGGDVDFYCPASLGSDRISERVLVGDCYRGIISIDTHTEERTLIKEPVGQRVANYGMYLYVEEGWEVLYYVDRVHRALLMLDLETKEHVILSKGVSPD